MNLQDSMFNDPVPHWPERPPFGKSIADRLWWLWDKGINQWVADDDNRMQYEYWVAYDGLGEVLDTDALARFKEWYLSGRQTPGEHLRRTRQWMTSDTTTGGPYIKETSRVKQQRAAKEAAIRHQRGNRERT